MMKLNQETSILVILLVSVIGAVITWVFGFSLGVYNATQTAIAIYMSLSLIMFPIWVVVFMIDTQRGVLRKKPKSTRSAERRQIGFDVRIGNGPWERRYAEFDGKKLKIIGRNLTSIDLSPLRIFTDIVLLDLSLNRLEFIDLSPLETCRNLSILNLTSNELTMIDLSPLTSCTNLKYLDLSNNKLSDIDLDPLAACSNLDTLDLGGSFVDRIELDALRSCTQLECLTIDATNLETLDLSPLESCENLEHLILDQSKIKRLDITPLFSCRKLDLLEIDRIELTASSAISDDEWPEGIVKHRDKVTLSNGI
ncbi:MAG: leucine-rich repeat protein [Candidatus Thorarchaeota archaeon]